MAFTFFNIMWSCTIGIPSSFSKVMLGTNDTCWFQIMCINLCFWNLSLLSCIHDLSSGFCSSLTALSLFDISPVMDILSPCLYLTPLPHLKTYNLLFHCRPSEFLEFVNMIEAFRVRWVNSEAECQRLHSQLVQANTEITRLENNVKQVMWTRGREGKRVAGQGG